MTRHYRDISQYQNGASITSSSATLTLGTLLTGRGLTGLAAPYTLVIQKSDGTNREEVNVNSTATFPQLGIDRGLNGTAVSHDTTELVTMLVGENDLQNFAQLDGGLQAGTINLTGGFQINGRPISSTLFYNVKDYGALGDGVADDSTAIQSLINTIGDRTTGKGGTIFFPPGTYLCNSPLTFPHDATFPGLQESIRLLGAGTGWRPGPPIGGSILDLRSAGSGPAMIDARGSGWLEIAGLSIINNGSATTPLIQSVNTTLHIHDCGFFGNTAHSRSGCVQDAIVLGGAATSSTNGMAATSPFAGYGTVIQNNFFENIRHCVLAQTSANAVVIRDNTIWTECGGDAAILVSPAFFHNSGLVIDGNLIEMDGYTYGIKISNTINSTLTANGFYDGASGTPTAGIRFDTGTSGNVVAGGNVDDGSMPLVSDSTGTNTVLGSGTAAATTTALGTVEVDNNSGGTPIAITEAGYLSSITALTNSNIAAGAAIAPTKLGSGEYTGTDFKATGKTGATTASAYAGATAGGAPISGTFAVGDMVLDVVNARVYICTVAGTPGTFTVAGGGMTNPMTTANDLIIGGTAGAPARLASVASRSLQTDASGNILWSTIPAGGSATLAGDSDVTISSPAAHDILQYSGSTWANVQGGMIRLQKTTLGSAAATITLNAGSSIPGTYSALRILLVGRIDESTTDDWVLLQFNADTGSNYDWTALAGNGSSATSSESSSAGTSIRLADLPGATATANMAGVLTVDIPLYAGTTFYKELVSESYLKYGTGLNAAGRRSFGGQWRSTSAITSITFLLGTGNFITGTTAILYGIA